MGPSVCRSTMMGQSVCRTLTQQARVLQTHSMPKMIRQQSTPARKGLQRHGLKLLGLSGAATALSFSTCAAATEAKTVQTNANGFNIVRRAEGGSQSSHSRVRPSSLDELAEAAADYDVLLVGEVHDDAEAHRLELALLKQIHEKHSASRQIVLSLEMFETDTQTVLDEYLKGLIRVFLVPVVTAI